jgi:hypothetical protein
LVSKPGSFLASAEGFTPPGQLHIAKDGVQLHLIKVIGMRMRQQHGVRRFELGAPRAEMTARASIDEQVRVAQQERQACIARPFNGRSAPWQSGHWLLRQISGHALPVP